MFSFKAAQDHESVLCMVNAVAFIKSVCCTIIK